MSVRDDLLAMLARVAEALGKDMRDRLVFVGGCTTAFFVTDKVTLQGVRNTDDVDLIVDLAGPGQWGGLVEELDARGFRISGQDDVVCRFRLDGLKVDFMPNDEAVLGFTNRWYDLGMKTSVTHDLTDTLTIRLLTPPLFLATKLEAWRGRGKNDMLFSHDLEDILLVVDGRVELVDEVKAAPPELRAYLAKAFQALMIHPEFDHLVEGNARPAGREVIIHERIALLAGIDCDGD